MFHIHENDDVEITGYLILQAFDLLAATHDEAFIKEISPMLKWAFLTRKESTWSAACCLSTETKPMSPAAHVTEDGQGQVHEVLADAVSSSPGAGGGGHRVGAATLVA